MEEISLLTSFFPDCRYMPQLRRYSPTNLSDGAKMAIFLCPVFSASHVQHISDMHSKFALIKGHTMCAGSMVDIKSTAAEIRRGKKKKEETTGQKCNGLPYYIGRPL